VIELRVTFLDVEPDDDDDDDEVDGSSCSYDCLQLFDGPDARAEPLSARLCGHVAPSTTFLTSSNAACVHFRSDYFTTGTGFQLSYHVGVPQSSLQTQRRTGAPIVVTLTFTSSNALHDLIIRYLLEYHSTL